MTSQADYSLAVDIGGTFTDAVLRHRDGRTWVGKVLTTYNDLLDGFFGAVNMVLADAAKSPRDVDNIVVHATTLVTNCVIERKGAKTGLLVTAGFRDVLQIRDESRSNIFDNQIEFVEPLVPRELTLGVTERMIADGTVETRPDPSEVIRQVETLARAGVKSIAVCFLHSYRNDENEKAVGDIIRRHAPELFVSLSSDVAPQIREYPRATTAVINAYTMPMAMPYLRRLAARLKETGFRQTPLIMLSNGGVIGAETAGRYPVRMIESGPAAGALAARYFSTTLEIPNLLAFDMGGTTAKACFIRDHEPMMTGLFEVDRKYRFLPGSGMPVTVPCIDMIEIGAGGGSIAAADSFGLLSVGPQSAGSEPGPVCYGRGGDKPTVTDADLVLGIFDADNFAGGALKLDRAGAEAALRRLGLALGVDAEQIAAGIYKLVCESMAGAIRSHASDQGLDWRRLPVLAFGGAGPVHACHVAELIESTTVIFPPLASVLSAFGTLVSPISLDLARGDLSRLTRLDWDKVADIHGKMIAEGRAALIEAGCAADRIDASFAADMRYMGQQYEISVLLPETLIRFRSNAQFRELFEADYQRIYGVKLAEADVEIVNWRMRLSGPPIPRQPIVNAGTAAAQAPSRRRVVFPRGAEDTPVFVRSQLRPGARHAGPALIEERDTTIVILPGWEFEVDASGAIFANRIDAGAASARPGAVHERRSPALAKN